MCYNEPIVVKNTTPSSFEFLREISLSVGSSHDTDLRAQAEEEDGECRIPGPTTATRLAEGGDIHRNPNSRVELVHATHIAKALPADIKSYHFFRSPHSFRNHGHVSLNIN